MPLEIWITINEFSVWVYHFNISYNIWLKHIIRAQIRQIYKYKILLSCPGASSDISSCQPTLWPVQKHKIFNLPWPWRVGSRSLSPLYERHQVIHRSMSPVSVLSWRNHACTIVLDRSRSIIHVLTGPALV